ncbi:cache domain-containing protein [Desulfomarina sp.]
MKKNSFITIFQQHVFILIVVLIGFIRYFWMNIETARSNQHVKNIREVYLSHEKELIKTRVEDTLNYIHYKIDHGENIIKTAIKQQTEQAFQVALSLYKQNAQVMQLQNIKTIITENLREQCRNNTENDFFVITGKGEEVIDCRNTINSNNSTYTKTLPDTIKSNKKQSFYFTNTLADNGQKRIREDISYVKFFQPFGWIIGTRKNDDNMNKAIRKEVLSRLENLHTSNGGHIFVGTWKGLTLLGPARGKNMWTITDPKGVKVVQELIARAKSGGGFVQYVMPRIPGQRPAPKISYVNGVPEWHWYVGMGVYVDYIDAIIQEKQAIRQKDVNTFLVRSTTLLLTLLLLSFMFNYLLSRKIQYNVRLFLDFFRKSAEDATLIDLDKITFKEFHSLAESANRMTEERQHAWESLKQSQNYLESVFNAPNEAILIYSLQEKTVHDVNHAMLKMYGISYENALRPLHESRFFSAPPYSADEALKKIELTVSEGPQIFEWPVVQSDGKLFWTEISLNLAQLNGQDYIIAVQRDIDAKKRAERKLATEQERIAVTLRSIGEGVIAADTDGKISIINEAAEKITGWPADEAIGKNTSAVFNLVDEQTGEKCENPIGQIISSGKKRERSGRRILITRHGKRINIADSGAPIFNQEKKIIGVVLVFRDITNEKKTEQELLKIRKLEAVGVLAGGIAHDFNNILSAILGNIELAIKKTDDATISPLLQSAANATIRASRLTQQLLTFAKGGEPIRETMALPEIIRESADFVLHGSNITCSYDFASDLHVVDIDSGQIGQVVQNIIINAKQAMPTGGIIKISCSNTLGENESLLRDDDGHYVKISIRDSGTGIDGQTLGRIFDPYFSTKAEGSGLGLAICHSIIKKHNGHILAESTPGEGTVFTLYLPVSRKSTDSRNIITQSAVPVQAATIMVMDDEEVVRNVAGSQLEYLGHTPILVSNGHEALRTFREMRKNNQKIDAIIMDLTIPGSMGGKETAGKILAEVPDMKIIVASGYATDPVMANFRDHGFCGALAKPLILENLKKVLSTVLQEMRT